MGTWAVKEHVKSALRPVLGRAMCDTLRYIIQAPIIEKALRQCKRGRILDAGTGAGMYLRLLSRYGSVVALDKTLEEHSVARFFPFAYGTLESLPFADASFDVVACCEVLEHVEDDERGLAEIQRVLVRRGWLIISVPVPPPPCPDPNHVRPGYKLETLCGMLTASGFHVRTLTPCMGIAFRTAFHLSRLRKPWFWVPQAIPKALCWLERLSVLPAWRPYDVVVLAQKE